MSDINLEKQVDLDMRSDPKLYEKMGKEVMKRINDGAKKKMHPNQLADYILHPAIIGSGTLLGVGFDTHETMSVSKAMDKMNTLSAELQFAVYTMSVIVIGKLFNQQKGGIFAKPIYVDPLSSIVRKLLFFGANQVLKKDGEAIVQKEELNMFGKQLHEKSKYIVEQLVITNVLAYLIDRIVQRSELKISELKYSFISASVMTALNAGIHGSNNRAGELVTKFSIEVFTSSASLLALRMSPKFGGLISLAIRMSSTVAETILISGSELAEEIVNRRDDRHNKKFTTRFGRAIGKKVVRVNPFAKVNRRYIAKGILKAVEK